MNKRITKATFKSFINKNRGNLFIKVESDFDGMQDMVVNTANSSFTPANENDDWANGENTLGHTLGIKGVWLVGHSGDSFSHYEDEQFVGIDVYNSCGSFIVAVKK